MVSVRRAPVVVVVCYLAVVVVPLTVPVSVVVFVVLTLVVSVSTSVVGLWVVWALVVAGMVLS